MPEVSRSRGKQSRASRTRAPATYNGRPSVSTKVVAREVPQKVSDLEGSTLPQVFSNFFSGLTNAAEIARDAAQIGVNHEIDRANATERVQGVHDAAAGVEQDATLSVDTDYTDAYEETKGTRFGQEMYADFNKALTGLGPEQDADAFMAEYIETEFGGGTGAVRHDTAALAAFERMAQPDVLRFKQTQTQRFLNETFQTELANFAVEMQSGGIDVDRFRDHVATATALRPDADPVKARAAVLAAAVSAARTPAAISNMLSLLTAKDYGPNGGSFLDEFPEAGAQHYQNLMAKKNSLQSAEAMDMANDLSLAITAAAQTGDLGALGEINVMLEQFHKVHGADAPYTRMRSAWISAVGSVSVDNGAGNALVDYIVSGTEPVGVAQKDLNKALKPTIAAIAQDDDWLRPDSEGEAHMVAGVALARSNTMNDDVRAYYSRALADPKRIVKAVQSLQAMEATRPGSEAKVLSGNDLLRYEAITRVASSLENSNLAEVAERIVDIERVSRGSFNDQAKAVDFKTLYEADSVGAGEEAALSAIIGGNGPGGFFGSGIGEEFDLDGSDVSTFSVRNELLSQYRDTYAYFAQVLPGGEARTAAAESVAKAVGQRLTLLPSGDGQFNLVRRVDTRTDTPTFGAAVQRPDGLTENTVQNFYDDLGVFAKTFPGLSLERDDVALVPSHSTRKSGAYDVYDADSASPVVLQLGTEVSFDTGFDAKARKERKGLLSQPVRVEAEEKKTRKFDTEDQLLRALPEGFSLRRHPFGEGTFILVATPRFKNAKDVKTLEREFKTPTAGQWDQMMAPLP